MCPKPGGDLVQLLFEPAFLGELADCPLCVFQLALALSPGCFRLLQRMLRLLHLADQFAMGLRDFHLTFGRLSDTGGLQRLGMIAIEAVKALVLVQFRLQPFAIPHIACDQLVLPFAIPGEIHDGVCLHGLLHTLLITLVLLFESVQLFHPHLRGP